MTYTFTIIIIVALFATANGFYLIAENGTTAVCSNLGYMNPNPYHGLVLFNPFTTGCKLIETKVNIDKFFGNGLSEDGGNISAVIEIADRLRPEDAPFIIATYGDFYEEKILAPATKSAFAEFIKNRTLEEILTTSPTEVSNYVLIQVLNNFNKLNISLEIYSVYIPSLIIPEVFLSVFQNKTLEQAKTIVVKAQLDTAKISNQIIENAADSARDIIKKDADEERETKRKDADEARETERKNADETRETDRKNAATILESKQFALETESKYRDLPGESEAHILKSVPVGARLFYGVPKGMLQNHEHN